MSTTFNFTYKGFTISATITHDGDSIKLAADVTHPDLPSPEQVFALVAAFLSKKGVR